MVIYGSGNILDLRIDFIEVVKEVMDKGVVIVICCFCCGGLYDVFSEFVEKVLIKCLM